MENTSLLMLSSVTHAFFKCTKEPTTFLGVILENVIFKNMILNVMWNRQPCGHSEIGLSVSACYLSSQEKSPYPALLLVNPAKGGFSDLRLRRVSW